jgi:hypothetical protein
LWRTSAAIVVDVEGYIEEVGGRGEKKFRVAGGRIKREGSIEVGNVTGERGRGSRGCKKCKR